MRDRFIVALLTLVTILSAAVSAEERKVSDSAKTLIDDPYYIIEGAVTSFRTCLGVANDHRAMKLWDSNDPMIVAAKAAGSRERVAVLQSLPRQVRLKLGFGTIYTCAQIAEAWLAEGRPSGRDLRMNDNPHWQDGRRRHGTIVIDLNLDQYALDHSEGNEGTEQATWRDNDKISRGMIEAIPLVRILTSPRLLPPRDFGGVVIRNAEIDGALLFYNVHLGIPLAFANVRFRGHHYAKSVFGDESEDPVLDAAISIVNSQFGDHFQISSSDICGTIRFTDSRFIETVSLRKIQQFPIDCESPAKGREKDTPGVIITTSTLNQNLKTVQSDFGKFHISGSDIHSFASSRTYFGNILSIIESDVGALQINCSILANYVDISYNQIRKDFFIYGSKDLGKLPNGEKCSDWWSFKLTDGYQTSIRIASNRIGGGLGVRDLDGAMILPTERDGNVVLPTIDLTSNRVGNGSEIMLPAFSDQDQLWQGRVNLEGSTYQGKIEIGVKVDESKGDEPDATSELDDLNSLLNPSSGFCDEVGNDLDQRPYAVVDLKAARIRTLAWNLPFDCHYRWAGYGLIYDLWLAEDYARKSAGIDDHAEDQVILTHWRETLAHYEPASLNTMSDYLAGKGSYVDSRSILLEAKRLNYAPTCRPDSWGLECAGKMIAGLWTWWPGVTGPAKAEGSPNDAGSTSGDTSTFQIWEPFKSWFWSAWNWLWSFFMLFLLWPGGYGAQPERGLLLMAVSFGIFWSFYWYYSRWMGGKLVEVPSLIRPLLRYELVQTETTTSGSNRKNEFNESQGLFEHKPTTIRELIRFWPKETPWSSKDVTDEDRLQKVQEPLLEAVQSCETYAQKTGVGLAELRTLRKQLERFGNTETFGFSRFDKGRMPTRFTHWLYSVDTMLPVIDLHAYGNYYPIYGPIRAVSAIQHLLGWWWVTVFIASAAIL